MADSCVSSETKVDPAGTSNRENATGVTFLFPADRSGGLECYLGCAKQEMLAEIQGMDPESLKGGNLQALAVTLASRFYVGTPFLVEAGISWDRKVVRFARTKGFSEAIQVTFRIPFVGNGEIFNFSYIGIRGGRIPVVAPIGESHFDLAYLCDRADPVHFREKFLRDLVSIKSALLGSSQLIEAFNGGLAKVALGALAARVQLHSDGDWSAELGYPRRETEVHRDSGGCVAHISSEPSLAGIAS